MVSVARNKIEIVTNFIAVSTTFFVKILNFILTFFIIKLIQGYYWSKWLKKIRVSWSD